MKPGPKSPAAQAAEDARWEHIWQTRHHQPWLRLQAALPPSLGSAAGMCAALGEPERIDDSHTDYGYSPTNPRRSKYERI